MLLFSNVSLQQDVFSFRSLPRCDVSYFAYTYLPVVFSNFKLLSFCLCNFSLCFEGIVTVTVLNCSVFCHRVCHKHTLTKKGLPFKFSIGKILSLTVTMTLPFYFLHYLFYNFLLIKSVTTRSCTFILPRCSLQTQYSSRTRYMESGIKSKKIGRDQGPQARDHGITSRGIGIRSAASGSGIT